MFLRVPVIITIRFGENVFGRIFIDIYIHVEGGHGWVWDHTWIILFFSFIIQKN